MLSLRPLRAQAPALALLALLAACDRTPDPRPPPPTPKPTPAAAPETSVVAIDTALARAAAFLRTQQGVDGAFRSELYPAFRDGYSLSPLALTALRQLADPDAGYRRGVDFTASLVQAGGLRRDVDAPRYPLYALAGALLVLNVDDNVRHDAQRAVIARELAARQLGDALGYPRSHPSHGGFSYSSALQVPRHAGAADDRDSGANLSATLFAIGALRLAGTPDQDPALQQALGFVQRCQNFAERPQDADARFDDGGFFFSPAVDDPNKAGSPGRDRNGRLRHRSYGSMTADGVRALLQLGAGTDAPRVRAAAAWLERHFDPAKNPGSFPKNAEVRRESAYYYYAWSVAHALRALGKANLQTAHGPQHWPRALAQALLARQAPDGSFRNAYTELREDDPLVATPLAAAALAVARSVLTGQHRSHRRTHGAP